MDNSRLWIIEPYGITKWLILNYNGGHVIAEASCEADARRIADEHNAWVILQEYGWGLRGNHVVGVYGETPGELIGYIRRVKDDTPVAAVLAAHAWIKDRKN